MKGRLLDCTLGDPFSNVALEEALFRLLKVPVLRVWENQRSVVIGRAQLAWTETDLGYCKERSIPVVRRFTAGGAVYNGPGNVNWSFLVPKKRRLGETGRIFDAKSVFSAFAGILARALEECSVNCRYDPPNRVVTDEGKISGMAAYISSEGVICHGTLLVDADLAEVEKLTTPKMVSLESRYPRSKSAKVANSGADKSKLVSALVDASDEEYAPDSLTSAEQSLTSRLVGQKYSREEWNEGDPFSLDYL